MQNPFFSEAESPISPPCESGEPRPLQSFKPSKLILLLTERVNPGFANTIDAKFCTLFGKQTVMKKQIVVT